MALDPDVAGARFRDAGAGKLSVWVGRFGSQEELERYIDASRFEKDVGYSILEGRNPYNAFEESGDADALFAPFELPPRLHDALVEAVALLGKDVDSAVVEDDFAYDPAAATVAARPKVTFLGVFEKAPAATDDPAPKKKPAKAPAPAKRAKPPAKR